MWNVECKDTIHKMNRQNFKNLSVDVGTVNM